MNNGLKDSVIRSISDKKKYLYHYTSENVLIEHIAPTMKIRFGKLENTNDPMEYFSYSPEFGTFIDCAFDDCINQINQERNKYKILALTKDSGFICQDRGYSKPRMWSQYGNSHRGVCLILDKVRFEDTLQNTFNNTQIIHDEITYIEKKQKRLSITIHENLKDEVKQFVAENTKELFFTKTSDWNNENESRYLVYSEEEYVYVGLRDCLVGIVFGHDCPPLIIQKIIQELPNAETSQLTWQNGFPSFNTIYLGYLDYLKKQIDTFTYLYVLAHSDWSISSLELRQKTILSLSIDSADKNLLLEACQKLIDNLDDICEYQKIFLSLRAIHTD